MEKINSQQRAHLFIFGCILLRFYLVYLAYSWTRETHETNKSQTHTKVYLLAFVALLIGGGMGFLYAFNLRQTAFEAGGNTWWNSLRPIHSALWIFAAIFLLTPKLQQYAFIFLLADTLLGLERWVYQRIC